MLHRFRSGLSKDSFYLHFPWFFSSEVFDSLIAGTEDEEHQRSIMHQIYESHQGDESQVALDAYVRAMGLEDWNWQQVQLEVQLLVDLQLMRAKYSPYFYNLYKALSDGSHSNDKLSEMSASQIMALRKQLYDSYLGQEQLTLCQTIFQNYISVCQDAMTSDYTAIYADRVSNRAKHCDHLPMNFDVCIKLCVAFPLFEGLICYTSQKRPLCPRSRRSSICWRGIDSIRTV